MARIETADVVVVGGGMAGASVAWRLAGERRVIILERETQPGYHSTGRSAALYAQGYGNRTIRALTIASKSFFDAPPAGFADHPLLTPRGMLFIAEEERLEALDALLAEIGRQVSSLRSISTEEARAMAPALKPEAVARAGYDPGGMDIDVDGLHQGFIRGFRARGGQTVTDSEVVEITRLSSGWRLSMRGGTVVETEVLVNAAGAWADAIAGLAGVRSIGLVPKRRTAILFDGPSDMSTGTWPMIVHADETFYVKSDAGKLLGSPADETPVEPTDVQPEELDVAIAVDRIERAFEMQIRRIDHSWAGLRSFVADKSPVVGFAEDAPGFFWLAGQGGYGIQTAPAMAETAAALILGQDLPAEIAAFGVTAGDLSPARLQG